MKHQKAQRQMKQCLDLVKLIKNRPRPQPYYCRRSSHAGRSRRNESNCLFYNAKRNFHRSCIFNCHNAHPQALESSHSSFHITNHDSRINSDFSSAEEISRKSSVHSKSEVELFKLESQVTVLSNGLVNELSKHSNTTLNTSKLPQETQENASPCCSNNRKSNTEETMIEPIPNDGVSIAESVANSNEAIASVVNSAENTLNASQSAQEHEATTTVAEHTVSRQILTDEEAGGDGHHNNSVIEIEITLLSGNDTNSDEEDEGDGEGEGDFETPMPEESRE
nr:uncharacterized protein LOC106615272 [Bactrocera oleae]